MNDSYVLIFLAFLISVVSAIWLVPFITNWHKERKLLVEDMNKFSRPKVPGLGGLAIILAFIFAVTIPLTLKVFLGYNHIDLMLLLPALLSIIIMAFVGFVDDVLMFPIRPIKPILALFASIPMLAINYGTNSIVQVPYIGDIDLGLAYPIIIIPFIIIFSSNAINIMADFDGLTPGNSFIISAALFVCAFISQNATAMLIFAALAGALLIFYFFNKFPAKVFTGNVGTLFIGCVFAVGAIVGHLKLALIIILLPYIIHFILQERLIIDKKSIKARPRERGIPQPDGTIASEYDKSYGLTHLIMKHLKNITEKKLVYWLMGIEAVCALIAIAVHYQRYFF